jgi:hypothetical protein
MLHLFNHTHRPIFPYLFATQQTLGEGAGGWGCVDTF